VDSIDAPADWYDGFFEETWLDEVALHVPAEKTEQQVAFVLERLEEAPGRRLLDLACGHGRISLPLARAGWQVTGLDLSTPSLQIAREASDREGLELEWVRGDMRDPPPGPFDAAVSMWTAFGYFEDDADNQRVLDAVAEALAPGGLLLVDVVNLLALARRFRDRSWERREEGTIFLQEHEYDILTGRNRARWTFIRGDGETSELVHSVRTYAPHELAAMLGRAGLEVAGAWGDFEGGELSLDSWRLILLGRRP
jgi:2-polyprenyl-3-methyl-5-hydroxy-6-metoxy-1,4-benzoquinol methylase